MSSEGKRWLYRLPETEDTKALGYTRPWSVTDEAATAENAKDSGWEVVEVAPASEVERLRTALKEVADATELDAHPELIQLARAALADDEKDPTLEQDECENCGADHPVGECRSTWNRRKE